ncbi:MAG: GNAT family N-acetyltransferase [Alphaproteobacteria bacterium]|nr:GNAT family N-acetyltransferase [Alphaproteobacteria bacterium]
MMAEITLSEIEDDPAAKIALDGLSALNAPFIGQHGYKPLSLVVRRKAEDAPVGGAFGWCFGGWYYLHLLFLPEDMRGTGLGSDLLTRLEDEARDRGCIGAWVDTFSFQARPFYEKHGYTLFGSIEDQPPGHARHFLFKRFNQG